MMNKKKRIFIISLCICIIYGIYLFIAHSGNTGFYDGKAKLWKYLTLWDNGTEGIFFIMVVMLCMFGVVFSRYRQFYDKFDQNCILRIGLKNYLFQNIKGIIVESITFMSILHIALLLFDFIYFQDPIFDQYAEYCYIVDNQLWNFIIFIFLSLIGMAILNIFIYSLSILIRNIYIFAVLPVILIFVTLMTSDVFVQLIGPIFDYLTTRVIFMALIPSALIQPCANMDYPFITYIISAICYISLSLIIFKYSIHKKYKEG